MASKYLNRKAACLLTVVDSHYKNQAITAEEREKSLNNMIVLFITIKQNYKHQKTFSYCDRESTFYIV